MKAAQKQPMAATFSEKLYRFLLMAYPAEHRREYGTAMVQLFRDQCRDATKEGGWRGLGMLWLRTLLDLVKTSVLERLAAIKGKEFLFKKIFMKTRSPSEAVIASLVIAAVIFLLVVAGSTFITLLLPDMYAGYARIKVEPVGSKGTIDPYLLQAEWRVIESDAILKQVIENLELNETWGKQFKAGVQFTSAESLAHLKRQINLRTFRNTSLIEIRAYSYDKKEAADIANEIAKVYQEYRSGRVLENQRVTQSASVQILDRAEPSSRPARPNHYLDIFIGMVIGALVGGGVGISFLMISLRRFRMAP